MVYTKARLEHALKAFREVSVWRKKKGLQSENLERHLRSKCLFRKASNALPIMDVSLRKRGEKEVGSDDEEYDPSKERKKHHTRRKRKAETKRKAEDALEHEQVAKKSKKENTPLDDGCVYLSLKISSEKGIDLLAKLGHEHETDIKLYRDIMPDDEPPSYWKKYAAPSLGSKVTREIPMLRDESQHPDDCMSTTATMLRDGIILARPKVNLPQRGNKTILQPNACVTRKLQGRQSDEVVEATISHLSSATKSNVKLGSAFQPIELLYSSDDETKPTSDSAGVRGSRPGDQHVSIVKHETPSLSKRYSPPYHQQSSILTIETAYAHPIDFRFVPPQGEICEFCTDYRTGVLGYGKIHTSVYVDPEHPTQFQEIGNGHRSRGRANTKLCISCALDRLLIMRCHSEQEEETLNARIPTSPILSFERIVGTDHDEQRLNDFLHHLFRKRGQVAPTKWPPLPVCSLCPAPARWQCCRWQKMDKVKNPCLVPSSNALSQQSTTATSVSSFLDPQTNGLTSIESLQETNTVTAPLTVSTRSANRHALRPPLRGCGLKLCNRCKNTVVNQCGGVLDKKRVSAYLRQGNRFGGRADVEWLFKGSLLERCYEAGSRR